MPRVNNRGGPGQRTLLAVAEKARIGERPRRLGRLLQKATGRQSNTILQKDMSDGARALEGWNRGAGKVLPSSHTDTQVSQARWPPSTNFAVSRTIADLNSAGRCAASRPRLSGALSGWERPPQEKDVRYHVIATRHSALLQKEDMPQEGPLSRPRSGYSDPL